MLIDKVFKYLTIVWVSGSVGWLSSMEYFSNQKTRNENNFTRCFYDAVQRNRPAYNEDGSENLLDSTNLMYLEGLCTGRTGADLRFVTPKYKAFKYDVE